MEELCQAALQREESDHSDFLIAACGDDQALQREAESLLSYEKVSQGLLESSPLEFVARMLTAEKRGREISDCASDCRLGQMVSHYRIIERLGTGGMGVVYKAEDTRLRRFVALKFLSDDATQYLIGGSADPLANRQALEHVEHEARACAILDHPNICTIYEVDIHEGTPFIAMQLLVGRTLKQDIGGKPLALPQVLEWGWQIADGLSAAHAVAILHRDIKSANIFISPRGNAKILDFGLAKLVPARRNSTGAQFQTAANGCPAPALLEHSYSMPGFGTTAYMSPEQVSGQELDLRSDLFSFGVVLYEMATGTLPFQGETPEEVFDAIQHREPIAPSILNSSVPSELERIIRTAMRKQREQRYQTAEEIGADLKRLKRKLEETPLATVARRRWQALAVGTALAAVVLLAGMGIYLYSNQRQSALLSPKDTVVLADFTNLTGDTAFDETLKQVLRGQLERSPVLNILSDREANQTLRYMGHPAGTPLTGEIARDACLRLGSKALVAGSIARYGQQYVIGLKAVDCDSGNVLYSEERKTTSREAVPIALNLESQQMRAALGESLASIQAYDPPAEQATTPSIEALRAYSLGIKMRSTEGSRMAIPFFKRATELDPNFAMAFAHLGTAYYSIDQVEQATRAARKSFELRNRVSEREKLYIESHYYLVMGQVDQTFGPLQQWVRDYPRDPTPHLVRGIACSILGRYREALSDFQRAVELEPSNTGFHTALAGGYVNLDRFDEAKAVLQQVATRKVDDPYFLQVRYQLAFVTGNLDEMQRLANTDGHGVSTSLLPYEADVATYYGKLRQARKLMQQAVQGALSNQEPETANAYRAVGALHEAELGNAEEGARLARMALASGPGRQVRILAALALARAGEDSQPLWMADNLHYQFPEDTILNGYWLPCIRAAVEIRLGNPAEAVELLKATAPYELGGSEAPANLAPYPVYLRALAFLAEGDGAKAVTEFQKIIDHPGIVSTSPLRALARLDLARAYALQQHPPQTAASAASWTKTGRSKAATEASEQYRQFLRLWKGADQNIPILRQARIEYARLGS